MKYGPSGLEIRRKIFMSDGQVDLKSTCKHARMHTHRGNIIESFINILAMLYIYISFHLLPVAQIIIHILRHDMYLLYI